VEPRRILIIEDNVAIREMIAEILTSEGYVIDQAANGREALVKLQHVRPDAILLDLMMPVMDGPTFVKACDGLDHAATIPKVIMSASLDLANSATQLRDYGVRAELPKPFDVDRLLAIMHQVANGSRSCRY
jgi:CheY-like chemotaxis protein